MIPVKFCLLGSISKLCQIRSVTVVAAKGSQGFDSSQWTPWSPGWFDVVSIYGKLFGTLTPTAKPTKPHKTLLHTRMWQWHLFKPAWGHISGSISSEAAAVDFLLVLRKFWKVTWLPCGGSPGVIGDIVCVRWMWDQLKLLWRIS